ncbi:MAG: CDP-3,6-dideoxy-D-glycero-L-glycero-4-hexulose-4-reductase [Desulfurococcales archaeon ex4484_42]|nr:MAG: CDP-3,6-dideoxy-D-glycero-L-glycero-4-hexulose-4-reductase [Desulfurococcales archaeon ex4484_42]
MAISFSVHSYRGGTGKSTTTANLAVMLALYGKSVATIDLDLTSPGLHVIYQVNQSQMRATLNDYIFGKAALEDAVVDLTNQLGLPRGKLYFLGASMKPEEIAKLMREGYSESFFKEVTKQLSEAYNVDYVIFDTHPGLIEDTLLAILSSDISLMLMRMDKQDITGTYVTAQVLSKFGKTSYVVLNMVPPEMADKPELITEVSKLLNVSVIGVIPFYPEILQHRSRGVFILRHPRHPYSRRIKEIADFIIKNLRG